MVRAFPCVAALSAAQGGRRTGLGTYGTDRRTPLSPYCPLSWPHDGGFFQERPARREFGAPHEDEYVRKATLHAAQASHLAVLGRAAGFLRGLGQQVRVLGDTCAPHFRRTLSLAHQGKMPLRENGFIPGFLRRLTFDRPRESPLLHGEGAHMSPKTRTCRLKQRTKPHR